MENVQLVHKTSFCCYTHGGFRSMVTFEVFEYVSHFSHILNVFGFLTLILGTAIHGCVWLFDFK